MTREERFNSIISKWSSCYNYTAGVVASTGSGKTRGIGMMVLKLKEVKSAVIIVPTRKLKDDWEQIIIENEISINTQVIVVNTAIKHEYVTDLLLIDEAHLILAETFINVFKTVKFNKLLWLTATIERTDGRHSLLLEKAPIIDTITLEEAVENKWITPYKLNIVETELNKTERKKLDIIDARFKSLSITLATTGMNAFKAADKYIKYLDLKKYLVAKSTKQIFAIKAIRTILIKKWGRKPTDTELKTVILERFRKLNAVEKKYYLNLALSSKKYYKTIRDRKTLITHSKNKLKETVNLLKILKDVIVFAEEIKVLTNIAIELDKLGIKYAIYHSKQSKKERDRQLEKFENNEVDILLSAKALTTGVSINRISNGIVHTYNSSKVTSIQVIGRLLRISPDKSLANIFYLLTKDTQEEKWLTKIMQHT